MTCPVFFTKSFRSRLFLLVLVPIALVLMAGCNGTTCFAGIINGPNNSLIVTSGNGPSVCSIPQVQALVQVAAQLAPSCIGCSSSRRVSQVHLVLRGIEMHPGAVADENSLEWQEIAPDLARQPLRIDLSGDSATDSSIPVALGSGRVPIGTYYQIRLRLAEMSDEQATLSGADLCNLGGCVTSADGVHHPVRSVDGSLYLRVTIPSGLMVRGGQTNVVRLELSPEWLLQNGSAGAVEVAPTLRVHIAGNPPERGISEPSEVKVPAN